MSSHVKRPVTTRDIAKAVGVHQSTVSRALRNDPRIRSDVREKIKECARKIGYRPNPMVSAFTAHVRNYRRSQAGSVIAFLDCHSKEEPHRSDYLDGAVARANELGFNTETFYLHKLDFSLERLNMIFKTRAINSLLIFPVPLDFDLSDVRFDHLAVSTVDPTLHHPIIHSARADYFQGMQLALDTLYLRGYRRIAFCTSRYEIRLLDTHWMGGFLSWQSMKPVKARVPVLVAEDWDPAPFKKWVHKHKPDAIVTNCHIFFQWSREEGFTDPDVGFVSLSSDPDFPEVARICQNMANIGAAAINIIVTQIHRNEYGLPQVPHKLLVPSFWVDGASVRPPPTLGD